jgi:hypothetical protein
MKLKYNHGENFVIIEGDIFIDISDDEGNVSTSKVVFNQLISYPNLRLTIPLDMECVQIPMLSAVSTGDSIIAIDPFNEVAALPLTKSNIQEDSDLALAEIVGMTIQKNSNNLMTFIGVTHWKSLNQLIDSNFRTVEEVILIEMLNEVKSVVCFVYLGDGENKTLIELAQGIDPEKTISALHAYSDEKEEKLLHNTALKLIKKIYSDNKEESDGALKEFEDSLIECSIEDLKLLLGVLDMANESEITYKFEAIITKVINLKS